MNERVGVVGESIGTIPEAIEAAGGEPLVDPCSDPDPNPAFVIAVGESGLYSLVPDAPAPVLPVETGPGVNAIDREDVPTVLPTLLDESQFQLSSQSRSQPYPTITHPVIGVDCGEYVHALMDVTLVTAEPARISEYTIASGEEQITSVRADGIVIATPAGSHGYAHDAGGPRIAPETDVGAVVPIAPFAISADYWVLSLSDIRLTVERDDAPVDLFVDGHRVGTVSHGDTISLKPDTAIETLQVYETGTDWKSSNGSATGE
jgi:NAD+ kinase